MKKKKKNVGIFIFDNVEVLDFTGPYEVFSSTRSTNKSLVPITDLPCPFNVFTFSEKKKNIVVYIICKVYSQILKRNS